MDGFMVGLDDVRELDWIPESADEQEWAPTAEEILDALLNRPALLSGADGVRRAEEVDHATDEKAWRGENRGGATRGR